MILYEYEGKQLLKSAGIRVPNSVLINRGDSITSFKNNNSINPPLVLKAQVLSGKRAEAGGIVVVEKLSAISNQLLSLMGKAINKEKVEKVLVEEKIAFDKEYYLSIFYDTDYRSPVLTFSENGGTGIEDKESSVFLVDSVKRELSVNNLPPDKSFLDKLINLFFDQDMLLLEINPLVQTVEGEWMALDAKVKLDDTAVTRHPDWQFSPRGVPGYTPTQNEIEAKKIDEGDYRGTAGSAYFDLEGDIAVLSSGGGVSLTALDSLIAFGGKPANFTEYSGNPPKEKVAKLTKIVLNKPNIHGLWVIGTVAANFTDIYETLSGFMEGLRQAQDELGAKFDFPIVIRRGGPRDKEAFEMLRQVRGFNLTLQGEEVSISESAKIMAKLAKEYQSKKKENA